VNVGESDPGLKEKVVLITGGRRVGSALARLLGQRGARLALTFRTSRGAIEQTVAELQAGGTEAMAVGADLSRADEAASAVAAVTARFGRLDALVNMASVYRKTPFQDLNPGDFDEMLAANLAAPYHTSVAAARQMQSQDDVDGIRGKIVLVGDWATERPYKDYLPYLVAKGGLATLTMALAKELAPHISVALIQPAMIDPPADLSAEEVEAVIAATPMRRVGSANDVNRLILYLLEGTNFVTGVCYRVDGGRFLGQDS
jgi:pteridine reductase